jgi:hypothetical protein
VVDINAYSFCSNDNWSPTPPTLHLLAPLCFFQAVRIPMDFTHSMPLFLGYSSFSCSSSWYTFHAFIPSLVPIQPPREYTCYSHYHTKMILFIGFFNFVIQNLFKNKFTIINQYLSLWSFLYFPNMPRVLAWSFRPRV